MNLRFITDEDVPVQQPAFSVTRVLTLWMCVMLVCADDRRDPIHVRGGGVVKNRV